MENTPADIPKLDWLAKLVPFYLAAVRFSEIPECTNYYQCCFSTKFGVKSPTSAAHAHWQASALPDKHFLSPLPISFLGVQLFLQKDTPSSTSCLLLSAEDLVSPLLLGRRFFNRLLTSGWASRWELSWGLHICSSGLWSLAPALPQLSAAHRESSPLPQMGSPRGWLTLMRAREGQTFWNVAREGWWEPCPVRTSAQACPLSFACWSQLSALLKSHGWDELLIWTLSQQWRATSHPRESAGLFSIAT